MCRLFGVISQDPVNVSYYLKDAAQSLRVQSDIDAKRKQGDGWGIGWFDGKRPKMFKSPRPLYRDRANIVKALKRPGGNVLLGHVRWASNPLKLPRHELIGMTHTQPFSHLARRSRGEGGWLFVHNGTLYIPREVQAALGSWAKLVKGKNDSEVLFYWLLSYLLRRKGGEDLKQALRDSIHGLDRIWAACKNRYPIYKYPYHGVNWVLTNGRVLLAFCYVDPRGFDKAKALCRHGQPYYQLQLKKTERTVTMASEPLDLEPGWRPLRHGQLVIAKKLARKISVKTFQVM